MVHSDRKLSKQIPDWVVYGLPLILAAGLKLLVWSPAVTPFNADEAIVGLMARHINQGQVPTFFYGQYYMGSLDAILIAYLFRLLGQSVAVIRLVQGILYCGTVLTTILVAKRLLDSSLSALIAGLIAAVPPVNVTLYSTVSLGGYGEILLMGNLLLLGAIGILEKIKEPHFKAAFGFYAGLAAWGLGAGFAFWVFGLSLVYTFPAVLVLLWAVRGQKKASWAASAAAIFVGGCAGAAPWWFQALLSRNALIVRELAGGALANVNQGLFLLRPLGRAVNLFIFGGTVITGLRPPWSAAWLMLPLLPFVLVFWMVVLVYSIGELWNDRPIRFWLPALTGLVLAAGFIFTPYGDDPSGRYFVPLILPMALYGAEFIESRWLKNRWLGVGLIALVIFFNLGGLLQSKAVNPPGLTTQFDQTTQIDQSYLPDLISFLDSEGIRTGYSNYWVCYPLAFLSRERIIFSPRLPYHEDFRYTERDDRYPAYTDRVQTSDHIAYITTRFPALNLYLRQQFAENGLSWKEETIGDFTVFYDLSVPIHPYQIGLGETTQP